MVNKTAVIQLSYVSIKIFSQQSAYLQSNRQDSETSNIWDLSIADAAVAPQLGTDTEDMAAAACRMDRPAGAAFQMPKYLMVLLYRYALLSRYSRSQQIFFCLL